MHPCARKRRSISPFQRRPISTWPNIKLMPEKKTRLSIDTSEVPVGHVRQVVSRHTVKYQRNNCIRLRRLLLGHKLMSSNETKNPNSIGSATLPVLKDLLLCSVAPTGQLCLGSTISLAVGFTTAECQEKILNKLN
jgi:hypothetical protein